MNEKFMVEVIFHQPYIKTDEEENKSYDTKITTQVYSFEGTNRSSVMHDARAFMDKTIRHGLELNGGSVIKSIIHPSCILQIGLIDDNLYQKELAEGLNDVNVDPSTDGAISSPVSSDAEPLSATGVDLDEAS